MEVRGQDNKVIGMPTTLSYNPSNRDSASSNSSKFSSPPLPSSIFSNPPQTLAPKPPLLQKPPPPHKSKRDLHPNPDPIPSPILVNPSAVASGSNFKAPPPAPTPPPPPPPQPPQQLNGAPPTVRYRECLRNHAASSGGHVLDGCGEFMPSGEEDTPGALKCAACECHRNFHRKDQIEGEHVTNSFYVINHQKHNSSRRESATRVLPMLPPPPLVHHSVAGSPIPPMMMAFGGGGGGAESSSEDLNTHNLFRENYGAGGEEAAGVGLSKKRFRTKFSQDQKEKMMEVAEKMGWKIQKHDEQEVQKLCSEVGIKRQVFKVWMHNNKAAMKKKQL